MPVIGGFIASVVVPQLISVAIGAAISIGASLLVNAIFPPDKSPNAQDPAKEQVDPAKVTVGEQAFRSGIFGETVVGGHWVHANEYNDSKNLQLVFILADQRIWSLGTRVLINGSPYTLVSESVGSNNEHKRYTVDTFNDVNNVADKPEHGVADLINIRLHDGRVGQAADTALVANSSGWDSTRKFTGMAYVVVDILSNKERFSGIPTFTWIPEGALCYDIRKDTTAGGSGSHLFADPSTWEYTKNPFVQAYHYCRGFYVGSTKVLGMGYAATRLDVNSFITAMNAADEVVDNGVGGDRSRYETHFAFDSSMQHGDVLDLLCQGAGGFWSDRQGTISVFAGKAQSSVLTITDVDLIQDFDLVYNPDAAPETLYTGVQGTYIHSTDFRPVPYKTLAPSEFVPSGTVPKILPLNFQQVKDPHQAYILAKQILYGMQLQANCRVCLDIKNVAVQTGDWIRWTSDNYVIGDRYFKVESHAYDWMQMRMYLQLKEIAVEVFDDNSEPEDLVEPDRVFPVPAYLDQITPVSVEAVIFEGTSTGIPGLRFSYVPVIDPAVSAVLIEYRPVGSVDPEDTIKQTDTTPADGSYSTTNGVAPNTLYEARFGLVTVPGRVWEWSDWEEANAETGEITATTVFDGIVDFENLSDRVNSLLDWGRNQTREIRDQLDWLTEYTAEDSTSTDGHIRDVKYNINILESVIEDPETGVIATATAVQALVTDVQLLEGELTATATLTQAVSAALGGNSAQVNVKFEASAGPSGYVARYALTLAVDDGVFRGASMLIDVPASGPTRIVFVADQHYVMDNSGNILAAYVSDGKVVSARIPTITAGMISVSSLDAISATLGTVVVHGSLIVNGTLITGKYASNSITATNSAFNGGVSLSGSPSTCVAASLTADNGVVAIVGAGYIGTTSWGSPSAYGIIQVRLLRAGSVILTQDVFYDEDGTNLPRNGAFNFIYRDTSPGTSSITWHIDAYWTGVGGGVGAGAYNCGLLLMNYKA